MNRYIPQTIRQYKNSNTREVAEDYYLSVYNNELTDPIARAIRVTFSYMNTRTDLDLRRYSKKEYELLQQSYKPAVIETVPTESKPSPPTHPPLFSELDF